MYLSFEQADKLRSIKRHFIKKFFAIYCFSESISSLELKRRNYL